MSRCERELHRCHEEHHAVHLISVFCDSEAEMTDSHICSFQPFHVQHVNAQNEYADTVQCVPSYVNKSGTKKTKGKSGAYLIPVDSVQIGNSVWGERTFRTHHTEDLRARKKRGWLCSKSNHLGMPEESQTSTLRWYERAFEVVGGTHEHRMLQHVK